MNRTYVVAIIAVIVISVFFALAFLAEAPEVKRVTLRADDWMRGRASAKVVLVEYSDFQCPACGQFYPVLRQLEREFDGGTLAIVYRHFPLTNIHPNALPAALAAEAAGAQGKFWEMHDLLFEHQDDWAGLSDPKPKFLEYAKQLGIPEPVFTAGMASTELRAKVNASLQDAKELKLPGTPSLFINGRQMPEVRSYSEFKALVESEAAKK